MQPELQPVRSKQNTYGTFGTAISAESQKVLRNTYLLLALTMVPTIAGAYLGMATASVLIQNPIISTFIMLAAVVGLQFAMMPVAAGHTIARLDVGRRQKDRRAEDRADCDERSVPRAESAHEGGSRRRNRESIVGNQGPETKPGGSELSTLNSELSYRVGPWHNNPSINART